MTVLLNVRNTVKLRLVVLISSRNVNRLSLRLSYQKRCEFAPLFFVRQKKDCKILNLCYKKRPIFYY